MQKNVVIIIITISRNLWDSIIYGWLIVVPNFVTIKNRTQLRNCICIMNISNIHHELNSSEIKLMRIIQIWLRFYWFLTLIWQKFRAIVVNLKPHLLPLIKILFHEKNMWIPILFQCWLIVDEINSVSTEKKKKKKKKSHQLPGFEELGNGLGLCLHSRYFIGSWVY